MKPLLASVLLLLLAFARGFAADPGAPARPQPRLRLDPSTKAAVVMPAAEPGKSTAPAPSLLMERFVVKDKALTHLLLRPPAVQDPKGKFTPQGGGRFYGRDAGAFRIEFGLWPHLDIMADDAGFSGSHLGTDFVRIKW